MNIVVPIKQVPETGNVRIDEETGTIVRQGVKSIVNPLDLYAIEAALAVRERLGGTVHVLSMGPETAHRAIREAVSMGCDSGTLISDRSYAGSDTWVTSRVLAAAVRRYGAFDLVIFGERATDGDTGQVGPGVASFLGIPIVTYVADIRVAEETNLGPSQSPALLVRRLVENGYERYRLRPPAAITVVKEVASPRLPTLGGKKHARRMEVEVITNADLGLPEDEIGAKGSPTRVAGIHRPKVSRKGTKIVVKDEDDAVSAASDIVRHLEENGILGA